LSTSSDGVIVANRIWKRFRKDRAKPTLTDQTRAIRRRIRRADPWRWVLRDVDFHVDAGEAVAIVGSNGAGKSTLLKILTRVMYPYAGSVEIGGRVGAIIELRGGMHPDLTGRENAFMYGSLLGLSRREIVDRFDQIVDFADLSQAIDRQMKYYSSGMQMRLGFAIAAFLRPNVLLVDEVLAVGDAWFQQRCLDRMREVLNEGTTLVLVSHDLASVEATCARGLWMRDGLLVEDGPIREVLSSYRQSVEDHSTTGPIVTADTEIRVTSVEVNGPDGALPTSHQDLDVIIHLHADRSERGRLYLGITEGSATPAFLVSTSFFYDQGDNTWQCRLFDLPLPRGRYSVWAHVARPGVDAFPWQPVGSFHLAGSDLDPSPLAVVRLSPAHVRSTWERIEWPVRLPTPRG
jgi:ABC-type polysaccharide/polyol phosphate transport system ATPase subunit